MAGRAISAPLLQSSAEGSALPFLRNWNLRPSSPSLIHYPINSLFYRAVGSHSYISASFHKHLERLGIIEEQPILDHAHIVFLQRLRAIADRNELQAAIDGRPIFDRGAVSGLFAEEHRLVASNRVRQFAICEGRFRKTGFIKPGDIMPVPGEAVPTQPLLEIGRAHV